MNFNIFGRGITGDKNIKIKHSTMKKRTFSTQWKLHSHSNEKPSNYHKKKVVNGFNKIYYKQTINGFRNMGLISACK